jgi:hypothetical protein
MLIQFILAYWGKTNNNNNYNNGDDNEVVNAWPNSTGVSGANLALSREEVVEKNCLIMFIKKKIFNIVHNQ